MLGKAIKKIKNFDFIKKQKIDYLFISAPENVAWLLNIRGNDNPNSPIPNSRILITNKKKFYLIVQKNKVVNLLKEKKIHNSQIIEPGNFFSFIDNFKSGKILIDKKTCSIFFEDFFKDKLKIIKKDDPVYFLKSLKNKTEISHMKKSHIFDGVALTKFFYWIKKINKKKLMNLRYRKIRVF